MATKKSPSTFQVGDIVKLKSGGPPMTVAKVPDELLGIVSPDYLCVWFSGSKKNAGHFPFEALERAEAPGSKKS